LWSFVAVYLLLLWIFITFLKQLSQKIEKSKRVVSFNAQHIASQVLKIIKVKYLFILYLFIFG